MSIYEPIKAKTIEAFRDSGGIMHTSERAALTSNFRMDVKVAAKEISNGVKEFDGVDIEAQALYIRRFITRNKSLVVYMLQNDR